MRRCVIIRRRTSIFNSNIDSEDVAGYFKHRITILNYIRGPSSLIENFTGSHDGGKRGSNFIVTLLRMSLLLSTHVFILSLIHFLHIILVLGNVTTVRVS